MYPKDECAKELIHLKLKMSAYIDSNSYLITYFEITDQGLIHYKYSANTF